MKTQKGMNSVKAKPMSFAVTNVKFATLFDYTLMQMGFEQIMTLFSHLNLSFGSIQTTFMIYGEVIFTYIKLQHEHSLKHFLLSYTEERNS